MGGINVQRWLTGGIAAGAVIWVIEAAATTLYMSAIQAALTKHDLTMPLDARTWAMSVLVSLLAGLTLIFFYAAIRPRFGPGPRTAITVAVALWFGGYVISLAGYELLELFPTRMLALWGVIGLVEMILAALVGGWIYREAAG